MDEHYFVVWKSTNFGGHSAGVLVRLETLREVTVFMLGKDKSDWNLIKCDRLGSRYVDFSDAYNE